MKIEASWGHEASTRSREISGDLTEIFLVRESGGSPYKMEAISRKK
jgi:hypothetical protein